MASGIFAHEPAAAIGLSGLSDSDLS
jgi:hypothetical protein